MVNEVAQSIVCPGLFYNTPAQDGYLIRIRTPGGWLNQHQGRSLTRLIERWGSKAVQVTNRANLQIRSTHPPTPEVFQTLQNLGLAAQNPSVDHLRNVMTSPTAGIDPLELTDTRPLVQALDTYIQSHPELAGLPAKFSVGIDGGGAVGIGTRSAIPWEHRYNEIQLSAVLVEHQEEGIESKHAQISAPDFQPKRVYFRLALGAGQQLFNTQVLIEPEECVPTVAALAMAYLDYVHQAPASQKKPRMKHLLQDWGVEYYLQRVNDYLLRPLHPVKNCPTPPTTKPYSHLGIHPQRSTFRSPGQTQSPCEIVEAEVFYIGISLPLGQLTAAQLLGLVQLSETFGSGDLRLTPWQTVLLPDIPHEHMTEVLQTLSSLGLSASSDRSDTAKSLTTYAPAIAACAGKPGCAASATQTQAHAIALINHLNPQFMLDCPVNIHLTGCEKSCAQPSPAEITLLGATFEQNGEIVEGYHVYIGDDQQSFKHHLGDAIASDIPSLMQQLLHWYQQHQKTRNESFLEFTNRSEISDLTSLIPSLKFNH